MSIVTIQKEENGRVYSNGPQRKISQIAEKPKGLFVQSGVLLGEEKCYELLYPFYFFHYDFISISPVLGTPSGSMSSAL